MTVSPFSFPEWIISSQPVAYPEAVAGMEERVAGIIGDREKEAVWLLEHPPLYTAGTSEKAGDLLWADRFPVYHSGRGGQWTYHGPGQRIAYVMLNLKRRAEAQDTQPDLRAYVRDLEEWIIRTLACFNVTAERREGRVGLWVDHARHPSLSGLTGESKIAAIGVRVRRWITYHGIAVNVAPDLSHYGGIVPCGLGEYGVTSLEDLGYCVSMEEFDMALKEQAGILLG